MFSKRTDKDWQKIGERMPYFGVITKDEFKPEVLDQTAVDDFFSTGEEHIEMILHWVELYFVKNFQPMRCMDFGCGVGRLVIPLAKRFPEIVGVDVSKSMMEEAKINCVKLGLDNVTFIESDDKLSKVKGKFDFIHSFIVLQHIDAKRGEEIFERMLECLNENGVGAIHVTYLREGENQTEKIITWMREKLPLVEGLLNLIKGRDFTYPHISMNEYNMNKLLFMLQSHKCERTMLNFTKHGRDLGLIMLFQKRAENSQPNFLET